jgi:cytochrome b6-f complex iron-sulfur subunit
MGVFSIMKETDLITSGSLTPARREFLKKSGSIAVMSMFGVAFFTGCSSDDTEPTPAANTPPSGNNGIIITENLVTINLAVASNLANTGGWALISQAKVLVVNMGNNVFSALTSICTHNRCETNWSFASNIFTCTCHGSRFRTDGTVATGPATQPLRNYSTNLSGNTLTISLS